MMGDHLTPLPRHPAAFQPPIAPQIYLINTNWQEQTLLFSDSLNPASVWLFVAISRLKMIANSTCCRANNPKNGLPMLYGLPQKITLRKPAHIFVWRDFPEPDGAIWAGDR